ncbi:MAG: phosphate ABC transporter substrate-binding protein [Nitrospinales bacterium]
MDKLASKLRNILLGLVFLLAVLGMLAPGWAAGKKQTIKIAGSTTVLPLATLGSERFTKDHPEVSITVNPGGSGVGVNSVGSGRVDIGMISREITEAERNRFQKADLRIFVIGRDAVACVVSSEIYQAGIRELSKQQIRDIYLGRVRNWNDVGGPDRPIVVIDKERHRGTRHVFMHYIFGDAKARAPGARLVTGSNNEEQTKIAQSDSAIGMLSYAWINADVVGIGIRDGGEVVLPAKENISNGRYPISRNLSFVIAGEPKGAAKSFIDFIRSDEGRKIVEKSGYVPIP